MENGNQQSEGGNRVASLAEILAEYDRGKERGSERNNNGISEDVERVVSGNEREEGRDSESEASGSGSEEESGRGRGNTSEEIGESLKNPNTVEQVSPKRRGRAAGAKREKVNKLAVSETLKQRTGQLLLLHMAVSNITKMPELMVSPEEAKALASAMMEVEAEYDIIINRKAQVWLTMIGVSVSVYLPKVVAVKTRKMASRRQKADVNTFSVDMGVDPHV